MQRVESDPPADGRGDDAVQCGWYRGFYLDNFRPGILKYPGAFCCKKQKAPGKSI